MEKEKNNILIVDFMGWEKEKTDSTCEYPYRYKVPYLSDIAFGGTSYVQNLKFHLSWDWLMPVVDKIAPLLIYPTGTSNEYTRLSMVVMSCNINLVYKTVVELIKWHNEKK